MGFVILKRSIDIGGKEIGWFQTTLWDDLAYFPTSANPIHLYESQKEAEKVVKKSRKKWPDAEFKVEEFQDTPIDDKDSAPEVQKNKGPEMNSWSPDGESF